MCGRRAAAARPAGNLVAATEGLAEYVVYRNIDARVPATWATSCGSPIGRGMVIGCQQLVAAGCIGNWRRVPSELFFFVAE